MSTGQGVRFVFRADRQIAEHRGRIGKEQPMVAAPKGYRQQWSLRKVLYLMAFELDDDPGALPSLYNTSDIADVAGTIADPCIDS